MNKLKCLLKQHSPVILYINKDSTRIIQRCTICQKYQMINMKDNIWCDWTDKSPIINPKYWRTIKDLEE